MQFISVTLLFFGLSATTVFAKNEYTSLITRDVMGFYTTTLVLPAVAPQPTDLTEDVTLPEEAEKIQE
ncbi:hypothetical protein IAQ61_003450 [Plenodomus lingam]|uniref:Predicted protein n=1 Tax=Leptosphaeria maculans (strain JN3 / isolate v23.1.3 / race Av1-4-5-6-7-8) TaxID=985895 RepID=E5AEJ7_LEPMJ|nr:predicted protein [Plenodomus lingam JN3]KAH9875985.1 hypothetical protein IAQ61_003450 [Plenodomus lingam]CBY01636.1 predicted protein [Plenodomus lingam JN3]